MKHTDKNRNSRMPILFIGHGSPMNIVLDNAFTRSLAKLGRELPRPRAILVVSAHWLTRGTYVTCTETHEQIYDFYGFPKELYDVRYPAPGSSADGNTIAQNKEIRCSDEWGLDHASWAILKHMYPAADIPVLELSLDITRPEEDHYRMARELAPLRVQGFLIIGSGNIVHNLRMIDYDVDAPPYDWAVKFDEKVKELLLARRHDDLIDYGKSLKDAVLAIPTNDHYLPMISVLGMQEPSEEVVFVHESIQHGSISMRCFRIG